MEALERPARKTYLDGIRILACIGVIYNHVVGPGVIEGGAPASFLPLFAYFFCKAAVPLFLMISGTLLLSRVDTYQKTLLRCLRIVLALAFAIFLNYAAYCLQTGEAFDLGKYVLSVYRDRLGITYSYWYLYRYVSLLIMLPVLQRLTVRMNKRDVRYFLLFSVGVCGCALAGEFFLPWLRPNERLSLPLFSVYIGMLLAGYYVDRYVPEKRGYRIAAGCMLLLCNAISAALMFYAQRIDMANAWYIDRCDRTCVVLAAGSVFYLLKCADAKAVLSDRVRSGISRVGKLTFAVYLVSELLIDSLDCVRTWLSGRMPLWCADRLYVGIVFLAGLAIAAALTRIPLVKKLL